MTSPSLELQAAIVRAVSDDATIMTLITGIYDRVKTSTAGDPAQEIWGDHQGYISFGPEDTQAEEGGCRGIDNISLQLDIWSRIPGRVHCKRIIHELRRILGAVSTNESAIVSRRESMQQIVVDPDGLTMHGILRFEFGMENHG